MIRVIYLFYYLKKLDWAKFQKFSEHVSDFEKIPKYKLYYLILKDSLRYNISILEFFQFHFYKLNEEEKKEWAGTGFMYEYQRIMNPLESRDLLEDKLKFLKYYKQFINRTCLYYDEIKSGKDVTELLNNPSGKIVLKNSRGGSGIGILILDTAGLTKEELVTHMKNSGNDLAEEYVVQHEKLMNLSPSGLNTLRIITQITSEGDVEIIACRLRISVNSEVDNMAAGNLVASLDPETGIVNSNAVYNDFTKGEIEVHPVTGVTIKNFQVPFWKETLKMVKGAALHGPQNRSDWMGYSYKQNRTGTN